jgi:hypothetical protein
MAMQLTQDAQDSQRGTRAPHRIEGFLAHFHGVRVGFQTDG